MNGIFIAFEGGEGSGKSTQTRMLASWFEEHGRTVVLTREPGGTEIGKKLRHFLLDNTLEELSLKTEALLFAADRAEHMGTVIKPSLASNKVVITDRYVDSFIAYENGGRQLHSDDVLRLARWATDALVPDLTILLDVAPRVGLARRGELDRMESQPIDFHERVRATYLELAGADPGRYLIVDAEQTSEVISAIIKRRCDVFLNT